MTYLYHLGKVPQITPLGTALLFTDNCFRYFIIFVFEQKYVTPGFTV